MIELAKDKGFEIILHKDEFVEDCKDVAWRFDVEFTLNIALKLTIIEND